jgi:hypothetical protein
LPLKIDTGRQSTGNGGIKKEAVEKMMNKLFEEGVKKWHKPITNWHQK